MSARSTGRWAVVIALSALCYFVADAAGAPSPELFGGLLGGVAVALRLDWNIDLPAGVVTGSQVVMGVIVGAYVQSATLEALGADALPVLAVCVATLAMTVGAGLILARFTKLDRPTAAFGMIAGGAGGIIAIADDLGADNRLVAVMQYLRVLVVLLLMPVIADVIYSASDGATGQFVAEQVIDLPQAALYIGVCLLPGILLQRYTSLPAAALLGPLVVAAALKIADVPFAGPLPQWMQVLAFGIVGLQVGLRFTPESVRSARQVLPPAIIVILAMIVLCAGFGVLLSAATGVSQLDAYLATTPGGLYAVIAVALNADGDSTFVTAVQVVRLFVMLLAAPVLATWIGGRRVAPDQAP